MRLVVIGAVLFAMVSLGLFSACADSGTTDETDQGLDLSVDVALDPDVALDGQNCDLPSSSRVVRGEAGTRKICQLTGEDDRERDEYTPNRTLTNAGIFGTDLGASFEHDGQLWFLFGDTIGDTATGEDAIARTEDVEPDNCIALQFLLDEDSNWLAPEVPGVSLGAFEVPLDGVSIGDNIYVYFSTDHTEAHTMGRSVLARSDDGGQSFDYVGDFSTLGDFINLSVDVVANADWPGLPDETGQGLLFWGSGEYRQSNVSLAWQPLDQIEDVSAVRYFAGMASDGCTPLWVESEDDAQALFEEPCVGELSVEWNPHIERWLMTYNCLEPRGIRFRTAEQPWGPWADSQSLFHPWSDGGYCHFMHTSYADQECDEVHDPGRENEWGGEYGPYQIASYAKPITNGTIIYFVMSTWNPYNVVLMRSELVFE